MLEDQRRPGSRKFWSQPYGAAISWRTQWGRDSHPALQCYRYGDAIALTALMFCIVIRLPLCALAFSSGLRAPGAHREDYAIYTGHMALLLDECVYLPAASVISATHDFMLMSRSCARRPYPGIGNANAHSGGEQVRNGAMMATTLYAIDSQEERWWITAPTIVQEWQPRGQFLQ